MDAQPRPTPRLALPPASCQDVDSDCAAKARKGYCETKALHMLKNCIHSCSEEDLPGLMRFHLPHKRTILSPLIDLPGYQPRLASFYATPPNKR